eukprot:2207107-Rhodomonas_salina.1
MERSRQEVVMRERKERERGASKQREHAGRALQGAGRARPDARPAPTQTPSLLLLRRCVTFHNARRLSQPRGPSCCLRRLLALMGASEREVASEREERASERKAGGISGPWRSARYALR